MNRMPHLFLLLLMYTFWNLDASFCQNTISPNIHVNQIGYLANRSKAALIDSPVPLPFHLCEVKTGNPVLKSFTQLSEANDPASGSSVWIADFSIIHATGEYYIHIPGDGNSFPFQIHPQVYNDVANQVMRSFYFLRCGMTLDATFAGQWSREACHLSDALISPPTHETMESKNLTGGWHEGGEYGKYSVSGAYTSALLLTLHQLNPSLFPDASLNIPESGNGIPDLLDEIRWEIEWLLRMQEASGGMAHKITATAPGNPRTPAANPEKRYRYPISTQATALAGGVFAKASTIYSPYDATFAITCKNAAESAWRFLEISNLQAGFHNPEGTQTKEYNDEDDSDERLWFALELFLATGNSRFLEIVNLLAERRIPFLSSSGYWGNVIPLAAATILAESTATLGEALSKEITEDVLSLAQEFIQKINKDGYRISIQESEFIWGSNNAILQNTLILLLANRLSPHPKYLDAALNELHYILGRNPLSVCYITGMGAQSPLAPYHPESSLDGIKAPIPGLLVGGPNQFLNDSVLKRFFTAASPPARCYKDNQDSFSSNETCITWNAALAFVLSFFYQ